MRRSLPHRRNDSHARRKVIHNGRSPNIIWHLLLEGGGDVAGRTCVVVVGIEVLIQYWYATRNSPPSSTPNESAYSSCIFVRRDDAIPYIDCCCCCCCSWDSSFFAFFLLLLSLRPPMNGILGLFPKNRPQTVDFFSVLLRVVAVILPGSSSCTTIWSSIFGGGFENSIGNRWSHNSKNRIEGWSVSRSNDTSRDESFETCAVPNIYNSMTTSSSSLILL
mmetsp:Transcript_31520/g.76375  ORF Transcript_31520/g.76375 Transcript_31520/m.76375 type:complete len:220 (+) Transcript_31520:3309-3968(+)